MSMEDAGIKGLLGGLALTIVITLFLLAGAWQLLTVLGDNPVALTLVSGCGLLAILGGIGFALFREAQESREREERAAQEREAQAVLARRLEEERARRLEEERARRLLQEEYAELRKELRESRTEESSTYGSSSASRSGRRSRENEARGGRGQGNVAAVRTWNELAQVVSELGLDKQNKATIGRLLNHGDIAHAEEGADWGMYAQIRIPEDELTFSPSILVMPHAGDLEIEFFNDDKNTHSAIVPSNGDYQTIWLPNHSRGKVNVTLDGPGYYWYSSNVGNDEGWSLMGAIVVLGEVPEEAKLDRPPQPRP